jgi:hypothetical protein
MSEPMMSTRQICMYCGVYCVPGLSGHICDETYWMAHTECLIRRAEKAESDEHVARNKLFDAMFEMEKLTTRINELEAAARWIPVEEGLPTKQGRYDTIWVNDRENRYRILDAGFTTHFLSRPDSTVEYWREMEPLPQPPSKGE